MTKKIDKDSAQYRRAERKAGNILGFLWHSAAFVIVNIFIIALTLIDGQSVQGVGIGILAWGFGLCFHGASVFLGEGFKEKLISNYLDEESK